MRDQIVSTLFNQDRVAAYDERWQRLAPMNDALHFLTSMIFATAPAASRALCVGAGTGQELLALARRFPQWSFTAVEPSAAMADRCRQKIAAAGFASRCVVHEGFLDSLPDVDLFDVATSILVSHFVLDPTSRIGFFREIATRLRPGGCLVTADLVQPVASGTPPFEDLLQLWAFTHENASTTDALKANWEKHVALLPPAELMRLIEAGGFAAPVPFYQALFIQGFYARRRA